MTLIYEKLQSKLMLTYWLLIWIYSHSFLACNLPFCLHSVWCDYKDQFCSASWNVSAGRGLLVAAFDLNVLPVWGAITPADALPLHAEPFSSLCLMVALDIACHTYVWGKIDVRWFPRCACYQCRCIYSHVWKCLTDRPALVSSSFTFGCLSIL